jgi:hypothetical protein
VTTFSTSFCRLIHDAHGCQSDAASRTLRRLYSLVMFGSFWQPLGLRKIATRWVSCPPRMDRTAPNNQKEHPKASHPACTAGPFDISHFIRMFHFLPHDRRGRQSELRHTINIIFATRWLCVGPTLNLAYVDGLLRFRFTSSLDPRPSRERPPTDVSRDGRVACAEREIPQNLIAQRSSASIRRSIT